MDIIKFTEYLKEAYMLPILDTVIDNKGILYNGKDGNPLIKGRITKDGNNIIEILGSDNKLYPAGIDKNGNLVAINFNNDGNPMTISYTGKKKTPEQLKKQEENTKLIKVNEFIPKPIFRSQNELWNKGNDYFDDIPLVPTGWVNVKVDMEIVKRVRRYASGIGENAKYSNHKTFNEKLKEFQRMSSIRRKDTSSLNRSKIQAEMSVIILLHYINEIKDFFHPSSSGFLFESFLAGLIPEARVKDDNTSADLISLNERYQIKFLDSNATYVEVVKDIKKVNNRIESSEYLEYYVIGLKYSDKIEIYIIDGRKLTDNSPLLTKGITKKIKTTKKERSDDQIHNDNFIKDNPIRRFKMSDIKEKKHTGLVKNYTLELSDIEGRINNIGKNIKINMDLLYTELSVFQYNLETLITGKTQEGNIISEQEEFDACHSKATDNLKNITTMLDDLVNGINK